jgi:chromosome segregation ATPase
MQKLLDSRDSLDKLYRDASVSLTTLERSHRFTMSELERHRDELKISQNEVSRLGRSLPSKDSIIRELRASKKLVSQELEVARRDAEAARHDIKALEDDRAIMKAWCDKAMDKAVRADWILMKRPGVVVPDDIVADILDASATSSNPSASGDLADKVPREDAHAQ